MSTLFPVPIKVAQYLRMSTERQQYSLLNQAAALQRYADSHGMTIIETYADAGRSGLRLDNRPSLQRLLADIRGGQIEFSAVLVYDVSRWGRFQDSDESAYYEYLCRRAGVRIIYCAEPFADESGPFAGIVKNIKRIMAGEYSRELSAKVVAGKIRVAQLGYRVGGTPGLGLRRQIVTREGHLGAVLAAGEAKSLQTDRVTLRPGSKREVALIRRIFRLYVEGQSQTEIAATLNREKVPTYQGKRWTSVSVKNILTNERYIGTNVYFKESFQLKQQRVKNDKQLWVRVENAFPAIVDPAVFARAQALLAAPRPPYADDVLLDHLRHLLAIHGALSAKVISGAKRGPKVRVYIDRFGSLLRAYALIGYTPDRAYDHLEDVTRLRRLRSQVIAEIVAGVTSVGGAVVVDRMTRVITVNGKLTVTVTMARCVTAPNGGHSWSFVTPRGKRPDFKIAVRMAPGNERILDYYIVPKTVIRRVSTNLDNGRRPTLNACRSLTLAPLYQMALGLAS